MTGVTFKLVSIDTSGNETVGSSIATLLIKKVSLSTRGTKIAKPLPQQPMFYFPMGVESPVIKISARLYGDNIPGKSNSYTDWNPNTGVKGNQLLKVDSSEYTEFPASSYWWVEQNTVERVGGYYNIYDMELVLMKSEVDLKNAPR